MNCLGLTIALCLLTATAAGAADMPARRLSVEEALDMAMHDLPQVRAARARMESAGAAAHSVRGHMLPAIHLSDSQSWYDSQFSVSRKFLPGVNLQAFAAFPSEVSVNLFTVAAAQPLLGLLRLSQDYMSSDDQADAGALDVKASEADARASIKTYFLRLFEARALADTAEASQHDLEEQVTVAQKKVDAGSLTTADVLRLKVASASAKQQVIYGRGQETSMRAALLEMLGLGHDDGTVEFIEPTALQRPEAPPALKQARDAALARRPELGSAELQASAAHHHATSKLFSMLPEINVQAAWTHAAVSPFNSKTSSGQFDVSAGSVGFNASWAVWEWGASYYDHQQAIAQAAASSAQLQNEQEQIGAEVAARHSDVVAAFSAVDVADVQVASAEEAYRVMQALSSAGSATTTDLLDAQAALTQARLALVHARYEAAVASVALARATGDDR